MSMDCSKIVIMEPFGAPDFHKETNGTLVLDTDQGFQIRLTKKIEQLTETDKINTDGIYGFDVPSTPKNDLILKRFIRANAVDTSYKPLKVMAFVGSRPLKQQELFVLGFDRGQYNLELRNSKDHWLLGLRDLPLNAVKLAENKFLFNQTNITTVNTRDEYLDAEEFGVRFPLVYYGKWIDKENGKGVPDARPLYSALWILQKAFCQIGWRFKSPWLESEIGRRQIRYLMSSNFGGTANLIELRRFAAHNENEWVLTTDRNFFSIPWDTIDVDYSGGFDTGDGSYASAGIMDVFTRFTISYTSRPLFRPDLVARICVSTPIGDFVMAEQTANIIDGFGDVKTIEFDLSYPELQLDINSKVYVTLHTTRADMNDLLQIKVLSKGKFWNVPKKLFIQDGDEFYLEDLLNEEYSVLDMFKGEVHLCNGKIYTDYINNEVWLYPTYDSKLADDAIVDGYFIEDEVDDLTGIIQDKSERIVTPSRSLKRYLTLKFNGEGDNAIQSMKLPKESPWLSKTIDFGKHYPEETETSENPFYEATLNRKYVDNETLELDIPFMLDNDEDKVSFDLKPRALYWHGLDPQSVDYGFGVSIVSTKYFGLLVYNLPFAYQYSAARYYGLGSDYTDRNVAYGEPDTIYRPNGKHKDLYNIFWKRWIYETFSNISIELLLFISKADYFKFDFRKSVSFISLGRTVYGKMIGITDFASCGFNSTPVQLLPLKYSINDCIEINDDDGGDDDNPCIGNRPELIIDKSGNCYYFSLGGSSNTPVLGVTFEWRYIDDTTWIAATSLCDPTGTFEARMIVDYDVPCPDMTIRRTVDACGNAPTIRAEYDYEDECFTVVVEGMINSPIDSILIEYSLDDGATWLVHTNGGCTPATTGNIKIRATVSYLDGCPDSIIETTLVIPPNPPICGETTADVMCDENGGFILTGVVAGDAALDIIEYRHSSDEPWKIWNGIDDVQPCPFEYRRVIFFCGDECPTYCGPIHVCNCINCTIEVTLSQDDNGNGTVTITATVTGCATPTFEWKKDGILLPDTTAAIIVSESGTYSVKAFCEEMCYDEDSIEVVIECDLPQGDPINISVCNTTT